VDSVESHPARTRDEGERRKMALNKGMKGKSSEERAKEERNFPLLSLFLVLFSERRMKTRYMRKSLFLLSSQELVGGIFLLSSFSLLALLCLDKGLTFE
jgi:hypothetical protein